MQNPTDEIIKKKKLDANALIKVVDHYFEVPSEKEKLLTVGGLTPRQLNAIILLSQGLGIEEITLKLAPEGGGLSKDTKKVYTYNTYDALNGAIDKVLKALSLVHALTLDYDKDLVRAIFDRARTVGGTTKTGNPRFVLPMKPEEKLEVPTT